jgi:uncharacterized protein
MHMVHKPLPGAVWRPMTALFLDSAQDAIVRTKAILYNWDVKIHELIWPEDRIDHIAEHGIEPEEVEDVCFGTALVQRAKTHGQNPVYYVLGQTRAGRYLFCVVIQFPDGGGYPVTARPMTDKEKRRYKRWQEK